MAYDVYSKFDIEQHKKKYVNYLEVLIDPDGVVSYAVPSHQELAIARACESLGVTRSELSLMTPTEWYGDWLKWLLGECNHVAVWNEFCCYRSINAKQRQTLEELKRAGLYRGSYESI